MNLIPLLLAQRDDSGSALGALCGLVCNCGIFLVIVVPTIAGMWKVFEKAGKPGWAAIIPFYNMFILNEVARKEILWFILTFRNSPLAQQRLRRPPRSSHGKTTSAACSSSTRCASAAMCSAPYFCPSA